MIGLRLEDRIIIGGQSGNEGDIGLSTYNKNVC
jgi:hypothetical protein